jgi:MoxR-like ATPase
MDQEKITSESQTNYEKEIFEKAKKLKSVKEEVGKVIVGQKDIIDQVIIGLLSEGHILLEGVPGLGKTLLVRTLADSLDLKFSRIQFTPDLMPADITGTSIAEQNNEGAFSLKFETGPVFANLILADEINRASPKTQSALLEAMQERTVTVRGVRHDLPRPFMVLATQNPLEMEGTYPLPEAQIDRFFFKILIKHPDENELSEIIGRTAGNEMPAAKMVMNDTELAFLQKAVRDIVSPPHVTNYAVRFTLATQPDHDYAPEHVRKYIRYGAGPRAVQALILASKARALVNSRFNISIDDIKSLVYPVIRHRMVLNFDGQSEGISIDDIIKEILIKLPQDTVIPEILKR